MKKVIIIFLLFVTPMVAFSQRSMFNINYEIGLPMGETADFISEASFRGMSFDGRGFLNDQFSVGGYISWSVFNETIPGADYSAPGVDLHGTQYRFINLMPIQVNAHYYFGDFESATVYAGAGVGTTRSWRRTEVGLFAFPEDHWHFSVSPEVGVYVPVNYNVGLNIGVRYDVAMNTDDFSYSNLNFNIGLSFLDY